MKIRRLSLHYLSLAGAIALGAMLRFWHLDLKPLWMDEIITAIFSLGKNYNDLPLDMVFPLNQVQEIFTYQSGVSCSQIAKNIATQSTHPPLFFCGMYSWLGFISPLGTEWVEKLRSLPALFGVGAITAIYGVNCIAFSTTSGILAAALMAVSPFAVYLSQEARHYTMPMFFITLALLGLMQIQRDIFERSQLRFWVWLLWVIINIIGLYVHYFFALALSAEILTILVLMYWGQVNISMQRQIWLALIISISTILISFIPWLLTIFSHIQRSETDWLPAANFIAPLYQTLINWVLMVIALPVEKQPLIIAIICGLAMVVFAILIGWQFFQGLRLLWLRNTHNLAILTLLVFISFILLQYLAIAYLSGKDITAIPRYHFVYYPSLCTLIAASLDRRKIFKYIILLVGVISCIFVVSNLVFQKPFQPEQVAQKMNLEPSTPLMLVVGYRNYQDVALGLSFALALEHNRQTVLYSAVNSDNFAFIKQSSDLSDVWHKLPQLPLQEISRLNLWVVAPGIKQRDYPQQVKLSKENICTIDPSQHYRIGVPYQLYRCRNLRLSQSLSVRE
ncbi:MAG: hypothetical protein KME21_09900 [Desmonostoc vinosum HA7617-LM4]|jgi:uncharacterized membrane protein|nr:hypothetical protein [Desmonostoc vinosum HA7617-LM4]